MCLLFVWNLCRLYHSTSSWTERLQNENRKYFMVVKYLNCGYSVELYRKFNNVFETPSIIISRSEELLLLWNCDNNLFVLKVCLFHSLDIQYSLLLRDHNVHTGFEIMYCVILSTTKVFLTHNTRNIFNILTDPVFSFIYFISVIMLPILYYYIQINTYMDLGENDDQLWKDTIHFRCHWFDWEWGWTVQRKKRIG